MLGLLTLAAYSVGGQEWEAMRVFWDAVLWEPLRWWADIGRALLKWGADSFWVALRITIGMTVVYAGIALFRKLSKR